MKHDRKPQKSFFKKILLSFLLIAEIPLLLSGVTVLVCARAALITSLKNGTAESSENMAIHLQNTLQETQTIATMLANQIPMIFDSSISDDERTKVYGNLYLATAGKPYLGINLIHADGEWEFSTQPPPETYNPVKYANWGIFRAAKSVPISETALYTHDIRYDENRGRVISITNRPNEKVFIIIDIFQQYFSDTFKKSGFPPGGFLYINDKHGMPLFYQGEPLKKETLDIMLEQKNGEYLQNTQESFSPCVFNTSLIEPYGLTVIAIMPATQMLHYMQWVTTGFLLLCLISGIISFFAAFITAKNISRPIFALGSCIKQLQAGNFSAKTELADTDGEFYLLAQTLNSMGTTIENLLETNRQKERGLKISEIKALQAQIHPHFIFNCLEVIKQSIKMDKKNDAIQMIVQLGNLFRSSLNSAELITVREEIDIIQSYLTLQQFRLGERLSIQVKIDKNLFNIHIPKFTLQPIIENVFAHADTGNSKKLEISITGTYEKGNILFIIQDNGPGIPECEAEHILDEIHHGHGLGIHNVHKRLRLYYGEAAGIIIGKAATGGAQITLLLGGGERE